MAIITEDYVSFETAKLLKEKGFDIETEHKIWYVIKQFSTGCHWNSCTYKVGDITREYNDDCCISMPTLQMSIKYLREIQGLYVTIRTMFIEKEVMYDSVIQYIKNNKHNTITDENSYNKIEEATEAAIKYCLENLI